MTSSFFKACFAKLSTFSLPFIPLWAGIHIIIIMFIFLNLYKFSYISFTISCRLWDVNDFNDFNAEHESVQSKTFLIWVSSIHCSAVAIAIISTVYTEKLSDVLLLTEMFKDGILKAKPVLPVLGSLDPSVYSETNAWYTVHSRSSTRATMFPDSFINSSIQKSMSTAGNNQGGVIDNGTVGMQTPGG